MGFVCLMGFVALSPYNGWNLYVGVMVAHDFVQGGFVQMVTFTHSIKCWAGNPACPVRLPVLGLCLQFCDGLKVLTLIRMDVSSHVERCPQVCAV